VEQNPNDSGRAAVRFLVRGRVQGVGFRYFAHRQAREQELAGWVRNREDGAVEGEVVGSPAAIERFLAALRRGPSSARVGELDATPLSVVPEARGFRIV
jgi:acylphosphatase